MFRKTLLSGFMAVTMASAGAVPVTFTQLTGATGASADTAVLKADLSGVGLAGILAIGIRDGGSLLGASGSRSGFDLDAIKLSTTNCSDAACAASAAGLSVFNFTSGIVFMPGSQRAPVDPKLFGTDAAGTGVDNSVATLGAFDTVSTTSVSTSTGFLSLGDDGAIDFNLTAPVATSGLFLYVGEGGSNTGANGIHETLSSDVLVSSTPVTVPEPGTLALLALSLGGLAVWLRHKPSAAAMTP